MLSAGGGAALGGAIGAAADLYTARENRQSQEEFAKHGIRWRVEDAQAAGVHPLFALGGGVTPFTPQATAFAEAGQNIGRAAFTSMTEGERALQEANLKVLASTAARNDAEAAWFNSRAATNSQAARSATAFPISATNAPEVNALYADALKLEPDVMVSRSIYDEGQTAGERHPGMRSFTLPGGMDVLLPATQGGGIPEDIDASLLPFVIGANLERYGPRWLIDLMGYATGRSPNDRRKSGTLESWLRGGRESNRRGGPRFPGREWSGVSD